MSSAVGGVQPIRLYSRRLLRKGDFFLGRLVLSGSADRVG